jgi:hypothetical protein
MKHHDKYLGKRQPRGLFKLSTGIVMNADVHGAYVALENKVESDSTNFFYAVGLRTFLS